jgi:radical SAM-linked protein
VSTPGEDESRGPAAAWLDAGLERVERPARYVGGEWGARPPFARGRAAIVLAHADLYEVGAARLGLRWLHAALGGPEPGQRPERCFLPAPDRIEQLRRRGQPLTTLGGGRPLAEAMLILLVVDHPLQAAHAARMLALGGLEPLASRRRGAPPVIGLGLPAVYRGAWTALLDEAVTVQELSGALARHGARARAVDALRPDRRACPAPHLYPRSAQGPALLPWCLPETDPWSPRTPAVLVDELTGAAEGGAGLEALCAGASWVPEDALAVAADELLAARAGGAAGPIARRRLERTWTKQARLALCAGGGAAAGGVHEALLERLAVAGRTKIAADVVVGAPGETDADLARMAEVLVDARERWRSLTGTKLQLEVELVPAAPWQGDRDGVPPPPWPEEELQRRTDAVRDALPGGVRVRRRPPFEARIDALLARAGVDGGAALVAASERLSQPAWADPRVFGQIFEEELRGAGLDPESMLRGDGPGARRPRGRPAAPPPPPERSTAPAGPEPPSPPPSYRYRLGFCRLGPARWLGHFDLLRALRLGLVRSGACGAIEGSEPQDSLRVASTPALPVGVASRAEFLDLELPGPLPLGWSPAHLNEHLPRGLRLGACVPIPGRARAIQDAVRLARYRVRLGELDAETGARAVERFARESAVIVSRQRKGMVQSIDIRPQVSGLRFRAPGVLEFSVAIEPAGSPRPTEVVGSIAGPALAGPGRIERTELLARIGGRWCSPLLEARRSRHLDPLRC